MGQTLATSKTGSRYRSDGQTPGNGLLYIPELPEFPEAPDSLDTSDLFQFDRPAFDIGGFTKTSPEVDTDIEFP